MDTYKQRLLNVARALRDARQFDMGCYGTDCGTPMCALGHYAFRTDLQKHFRLINCGGRTYPGVLFEGKEIAIGYCDVTVQAHFYITAQEAMLLFHSNGCGNAQTAIGAAKYIERFAEAKWPTQVIIDELSI